MRRSCKELACSRWSSSKHIALLLKARQCVETQPAQLHAHAQLLAGSTPSRKRPLPMHTQLRILAVVMSTRAITPHRIMPPCKTGTRHT